MQTIKTAFVVVLLLTVLYGAHAVLTQPEARPSKDATDAERGLPEGGLQFDVGTLDVGPPSGTEPDAAPSDRPSAMANDARPLVPPPSSASRFGSPAPADRPPGTRFADQAGSLTTDSSKLAPVLAIPNLTPQIREGSAEPVGEVAASEVGVGEVGVGEPAASAPPSEAGFAPAANPSREPVEFGPSRNAFVPPTDNVAAGGETESTTVPPSNFPASQFAPPTNSAGGFNPSAILPAASAAVAASPALPDPGTLARSLNTQAKELADGVRFDPKEALLSRGWRAAQASLKTSDWRTALSTLSAMYEDPRLSHQERQRLLDTLDPLAARVVYSGEHLLEPAYEVRRGDNLMALGEKYNVPWQLLRNINGIDDPEFLVPGSKLKVMRGPFRAEVDTSTQEMTVYLQRLYAGRFPLSIGNDPTPRQGDFELQRKELGRSFYAPNGVVLPAGDPKNPYGRCWLDLGSDISIHGTALEAGGPTTSGCIGLSPKDSDDVFAILSIGSRVSIR